MWPAPLGTEDSKQTCRSHTGQHNQSFAAACLSLCSGLSQPELKSRNPDELQPRDNSGGLVNPFFLPEHRDLGSASTFQVTVHPSTEAFHWGGEEGDGGSGKGKRGSRKSSQRQAQVHCDPPQQCPWTGERWQSRDPQESWECSLSPSSSWLLLITTLWDKIF